MLEYQDALYRDETLAGERDCAQRWELIRPHVPARGMMLDLGSNLGYFSLRAVQTAGEVNVVSIESHAKIVARQREIVASHGSDRICVIHGQFNSAVANRWVETCDWFELTLLLSVLHWMDDPVPVVRQLSRMSARMIVELLDHRDAGACGQDIIAQWRDPVRWLSDASGRSCSILGTCKRHTSDHPSYLLLVEGPVQRRPTIPYWDYRYVHPRGNDYSFDFDGTNLKFNIRGNHVDYVPGINLLNLMKLGRLVWPPTDHWLKSGVEAMRASPNHFDPLPHNMLWTPYGIRLIDEEDEMGYARGPWARRLLKRSLNKWRRNRMAAEDAYVPHGPRLFRKLKMWYRRTRGRRRSFNPR
jgi:SAM-dependent methyltransferase